MLLRTCLVATNAVISLTISGSFILMAYDEPESEKIDEFVSEIVSSYLDCSRVMGQWKV